MISMSVNEADERKIELHLMELPRRLRAKLRPAITELTKELLARVRASEPVRTGRLRQSTQSFIDEREDRIVGRVRVLAEYGRAKGASRHNEAAAALEYGAHRSVMVREHSSHETHVFNRASAGTLVMVEAYTRRANISARRFLRDPAAAMRPRAMAELQRIVDETTL